MKYKIKNISKEVDIHRQDIVTLTYKKQLINLKIQSVNRVIEWWEGCTMKDRKKIAKLNLNGFRVIDEIKVILNDIIENQPL